jgi:UDP-N-acetylmuramoylalanine-D-glutamate ligase
MQAHESLLALRSWERERPPVPEGPFVVAGLGEAGQAASEALARIAGGDAVLGSDRLPATVPKRVRRALAEVGVRVHLGDEDEVLDLSPGARTLVKSPGMASSSPLLLEARRRGIEVLDELELGWRLGSAPTIGVTGTNGKTTTATLATAVLAGSGLDAVLAGNADIAPPLSAVTATPEANPDVVVCEVSSFQLEGCPTMLPEVAVFTNLSRDHLSRHGTMRRYGEIKRRLFIRDRSVAGLAVIDTVEEFGRRLADEVEAAGGRVTRVGLDHGAEYRIRGASWDLRSAELALETPSGLATFRTRLPGEYNARNVAAIVALGDSLGVEREVLAEVLAGHPGPPGRFEHIESGRPPDLILDTASSPAALEQFLRAVRVGMSPQGRLRAVLGILGTPEPKQRRLVGRVARTLCDDLFLTGGSFRHNAPLGTLEGLVAGAESVDGAALRVIPDRVEAIAAGLEAAGEGDVVAVLGRGNVSESVHYERFDDRIVLRRLAADGNGRSGPEGPDEAPGGEFGVELEQGGIGR